MKPTLFFKIAVLVLALVGVFYLIRHLNAQSVQNALLAMGVEQGSGQSPGFRAGNRPLAKGEEHYSLCPTRIHAVIWADGSKVEESKDGLKLKWMAHDPQPREIGYLDIEKWLSQHCSVAILPLKDQIPVGQARGESITIQYIDGSDIDVIAYGNDLYRIEKTVFKSRDLKDAIRELRQLAQFSSGQGR